MASEQLQASPILRRSCGLRRVGRLRFERAKHKGERGGALHRKVIPVDHRATASTASRCPKDCRRFRTRSRARQLVGPGKTSYKLLDDIGSSGQASAEARMREKPFMSNDDCSAFVVRMPAQAGYAWKRKRHHGSHHGSHRGSCSAAACQGRQGDQAVNGQGGSSVARDAQPGHLVRQRRAFRRNTPGPNPPAPSHSSSSPPPPPPAQPPQPARSAET